MEPEIKNILKIYGDKKIIVCDVCDGKGFLWSSGAGETVSKLCFNCGGDRFLVEYTWNPRYTFRLNDDIIKGSFKDQAKDYNGKELNRLLAEKAKKVLGD